MIVLAAALMMAAPAAAMPQPPAVERRAFGACLAKFRNDKVNDKLSADAFRKGAETACATQEAAFRTSWINYDVAMKTRRSEAEENAGQQIQDYLQNSTDDYVASTAPAESKAPQGDSPVKPASSTTPPKP